MIININCDLLHEHYAPGRPVWSIQIPGFPEAITIFVIRSWKTFFLFVIPELGKSDADIVLKLRHEFWADTMLLWDHFRPGIYP